ncbi:phospholipid phosphatase-related protein type 3 [Perca flavescens]|uniref:phospholipid phosphatase-related protein type 3 n=1 Tax=Perca flavescens TaxID=8167 RepID=UPI00106E9A40|nr:phospholipid phosphatase-related protein type 3 [Perca flavescens]
MINSEKMKKKPPKDSLTLLPCFYFVELPIVASSMVSLYFLELTDVVTPAHVAFRCHDRELSMPYVDAGDELIPLLMLLSLAFAGPAASIMLVEGVIYCLQSRLKLRRAEGSINAGGCNFNSFLRRTVRFVGVHVFGLCATALLTDIIQLSTGYHAPFFLTVCKPNYTLAAAACASNAYITRDICSGHDLHAIMAARKTFPSQHATLSAFAAVYVSMYFNSSISDSTKLLKPLLVFAFAIAAAMSGLTQITQHRSHPIDVYAGFLIGAFIAAYLAFHAVGNFKSSDDITAAPTPPPPKEDALRALTERGHESVYNKGPASASESNDEIAAVPAPGSLGGPLQRETDSMETLKRASVDVELLAPRSPMGKETMLTFSNTLPRASANANGGPVQRRLKAVPGPVDPLRSQQLVSEWKQKSMEMRELSLRGEAERDASEDGSVGADEVFHPAVHSGRPASARNPTPPPGGAKAVATPRPPQIPEAGPPPVSPKSAVTRAKWLAIREKASGEGTARSAANTPRLMQVGTGTQVLPVFSVLRCSPSCFLALYPYIHTLYPYVHTLYPYIHTLYPYIHTLYPYIHNLYPYIHTLYRYIHTLYPYIHTLYPYVHTLYPYIHTLYPYIHSLYPYIHTLYPYIHTLYRYIHTLYPYIHSLYPYIHTLYPYIHTLYRYIHTLYPYIHSLYPYIHTLYPYIHTLYLYIHTLYPYIHTLYPYIHTLYPYIHTLLMMYFLSMQVVSMAKQHGIRAASSETSSCSGSSSTAESPQQRGGIVTVDAHAPHHPVVQAPPPLQTTPPLQAPPLAGNGSLWEWASDGGDPRDAYDLNSLTRGDSAARGSSFRPHRSASPRGVGGGATTHGEAEAAADAQRREIAMRRKTALVLLDRELRAQAEQENLYLQGRRFKD